MKKFLEYMYLEFKLLFRVPISLFFTILFPQMIMISFILMSGNEVVTEEYRFVDVYLPVMMLLSMFSSGIISFAVIVAGNRNQKLWQMYRLRGFNIFQIIGVQLFVNIILTFVSSFLLIIVAYILFKANIGNALQCIRFLGVWLIIALAIFLIGFLIGVFSKTEKVAQAISTPIMFILMIFSGIMVDFHKLPNVLKDVMEFLPTTQANWILVKYWTGFNDINIKWYVVFFWIGLSMLLVVWKLHRDDFRRG